MSATPSLFGAEFEPAPSGRLTIPALSLWQPWASAIALGMKVTETRSGATRYRGPLAIHATAQWQPETMEWLDEFEAENPLEWMEFNTRCFRAGYRRLRDLPLGAVVATATLADCLPTEQIVSGHDARDDWQQLDWFLGDFSAGRFGWLLEDVRRVEPPIPARGAQGLWQWSPPEGFRSLPGPEGRR